MPVQTIVTRQLIEEFAWHWRANSATATPRSARLGSFGRVEFRCPDASHRCSSATQTLLRNCTPPPSPAAYGSGLIGIDSTGGWLLAFADPPKPTNPSSAQPSNRKYANYGKESEPCLSLRLWRFCGSSMLTGFPGFPGRRHRLSRKTRITKSEIRNKFKGPKDQDPKRPRSLGLQSYAASGTRQSGLRPRY